MTPGLWTARAATAERATLARHVRGMAGMALGRVQWPPGARHTVFAQPWHYWWQAHLVEAAFDAAERAPSPAREALVRSLTRGVHARNLMRWTNPYYDDIAWLGLALQRTGTAVGAVQVIVSRIRDAWTDAGGGGIPWRVGDDFKNAPANGPAAILLARTGHVERAAATTQWITDHLVDPATNLVWDGLRVDPDGSIRTYERGVYTYCQGVYLGACVELASRTSDPDWEERAALTVAAVTDHLTDDSGVLRQHGDGDGGLFTGILARYLALAAVELQDAGAAALVLTSADAAWRNRGMAVGGPVFGVDWSSPAEPPRRGTAHDLSVQLSGWLVCEAAALVERRAPSLVR